MKSSVLKNEVVGFDAVPSSKTFQLPAAMPALPVLVDDRALLSGIEEQDLGYRIILGQLDLLRALAVDSGIVESMVNEVWEAIGEKDLVEKAVSLVCHNGAWIRVGTVPDKDFAQLVRRKINTIRTLLAELRVFSGQGLDETLFTAAVRDDLRQKLAEMVPYDYILNRAADQFRKKCIGLNGLCKDLVQFITEEVRISRSKAGDIVSGNWTSPKLIPALLLSGGHELKFYPPAEMRRLRMGITQRQKAILEAASSGEAPAGDLLASWTAFMRFDRHIKECVDLFVRANLRMVERMVYRYKFSDLDLVRSAASMGLVRAVYRFAPEMGFKFSTIAVTWIHQSILRDLKSQEMIRLPEGSHQALSKLKAALTQHPNASMESLVAVTGLSESEVENLMYHVGIGRPLSIDSAFQDGGSGEFEGMHEMLADPNNCFVDEVVDENASSYVSSVLSEVLNERELFVLVNRYGIGDVEAKTLAEMAPLMNLSKERIRQIERQALDKLRDSEFGEKLFEIWE